MKKEPRIVSLSPSCTEIAFALGAGDCLVGATRYCNYPRAALELKGLGGWLDADLEKVVKLEPDYVLTSTFLQGEIAEKLERRGLRVLHTDPKTLGDVFKSISFYAKSLSLRPQGQRIVGRMKLKLADLAWLVRNGPKKRIYVEEWNKPPMVSGNWVPELVELAGGINCGIGEGERSREVTLSQVAKFNPELIALNWCGFGEKSSSKEVSAREGWEKLEAVEKKRIYPIDDSLLNRPGPRLVQGMEKLARLMHPGPFVEYDERAKEGHKH